MEVTNLLDIHTREELYRWYERNHDKVSDFWLRILYKYDDDFHEDFQVSDVLKIEYY